MVIGEALVHAVVCLQIRFSAHFPAFYGYYTAVCSLRSCYHSAAQVPPSPDTMTPLNASLTLIIVS